MNGSEPRDPERLRRDLRSSVNDGVAHASMVGMGETYVPAFALALGHGEVAAGLLAAAPLVLGAALQLITPAGVRHLGSHRRWVSACAALQAMTFAPLVFGAMQGSLPLAVLFATMTIYWAAGFSCASAWNSWMATLIPVRIRGPFFAQRTRSTQLALLMTLIGAGVLLEWSASQGLALAGFGSLFALAAFARLVSSHFLGRQTDVHPDAHLGEDPPRTHLVHQMVSGPTGRLFTFLVAMQLGVHVSAPFFTPYMLKELELSYGQFVALTAAAFVARAALLPWMGDFIRRYGARRLLGLASWGVSPLAALWILSDRFEVLLALQLFAGVAWGAYELSVQLLFFEVAHGPNRLRLLAVYNLANSGAMLVGSLLGGWMLQHLSLGAEAYHLLFLVSFGGRAASIALLARVPSIVVHRRPIVTRIAAVRPSAGAIQPPIVAALEEDDAPPDAKDPMVDANGAPPASRRER